MENKTMKTTRRVLQVGLIPAVLMVLGACAADPDAVTEATSSAAMSAAGELPGVAVEAREVTSSSLVGEITASGLLRGVQEAWVVSETQGVIETVAFELGDRVEAGAVLVSLDNSLQRLQLAEAEERYRASQVDLAAAERLYESGDAPQTQLIQARSAAIGAQAAAERARKALEDRTLAAPIRGAVAGKADGVSSGNYLSPGVRVARIVDLSRLQLRISVGEREVRYIDAGAQAMVSVPACGPEPIPATVKAVAAGSDPGAGSFRVVVEWQNTCGDAVKAGMTASVRITPTGNSSQPIVPASAVLRRGEEAYIFVADNEQAVRRQVVLGGQAGNRVAVRDGVSAGELVITTGTTRLTDGARVRPSIIGTTGEL
jgi:membrane fusion protein (multidrug efflux system)